MESTSQYPTVSIAINKNKIKHYNDSEYLRQVVYLNDGSEFQLEFFNGTQTKWFAKIKFDGNYISNNGLILRPGERVFLERYFDSNNKFVYKTYNVKLTAAVKAAIQSNGLIEVEFYKKAQPPVTTWITTGTYIPTWSINNVYHMPRYERRAILNDGNYSHQFNSTLSDSVSNNTLTSAGTVNYMSTEIKTKGGLNQSRSARSFSEPMAFASAFSSTPVKASAPVVETGTIEKGNESNQSFVMSNDNFENFYSTKTVIQIMPPSQKAFSQKEVKLYCPSCGTKVKYGWKFCSLCGTKV